MIILNIPVDQISPYQEEFFCFVSSKTKKKKVIFIAYPVLPGSRFKAGPRNRRLKCPPLIRCHLKKGEGCYEQTQGVDREKQLANTASPRRTHRRGARPCHFSSVTVLL